MRTAKILTSVAFVLIAIVFTTQPAFAASLSLSPATATKNVGDTFTVDIVLDTEGQAVSGATAIIDYDPDLLSVVDGESGTGECKDGVNVKTGAVLGQCISNTVDSTGGKIKYSAGSLGATYTGRGVLATITFMADAPGAAQASFVFSPSSTTNTSLVSSASGPTNLLTRINDGNYTLNEAGTATTPLVESGIVEDTILLLTFGVLFIGTGAFLARKAFI